jgi:4-aminobutyrate aminotransferase / (S)-3-amino-2-methylpropionate transaminase / 5-aminovalerate transaminase
MTKFEFKHIPVDVPKVDTKYRKIISPLPTPETLEVIRTLEECESSSMHGQIPMLWDCAEGIQVYDSCGNKWLDFTSTIFVANAGHGNPRIVKALKEVLAKPLLHAYTYPTKERADYIKYLIEKTPTQFEKAFLLSAGTEATECALKLMRMYGQKSGKKRPGILCFENNWHGRTMGAQMLCSNTAQKEWAGFVDPNIHHLPFPYPWIKEANKDPRKYFRQHLENLLEGKKLSADTDFCGIMLETFQGWGAVFYPKEYVQEISIFAKENNILIAFDEMQAGFGRTGELFGYQHYEIEPDLLCCGKGASSGLPLSFVLGSQEVMDLPEVGSMSSTHSANPSSCVAGKANLEALLEDGLIENSQVLGEVFHTKLNQIKELFPQHISHVLGKGLLAAIHFNTPDGTPLSNLCDQICELAMQRGLILVHTYRESIKMAPPLVINEEALLEGISVFEGVIADCIERNDL